MKAPVLALAFILCGFAATYTSAATLVVTKIEDTNDGVCDADCSLREAVAAAPADDTIVFSSLFNTPQTITLSVGNLAITRNLTINGTGQNVLNISGNHASRIFRISGNPTVGLSGMRLTNGLASTLSDFQGGAIYLNSGVLTLTDVIVTNNESRYVSPQNEATGFGGGIYAYGATLNVVNSSISNNRVPVFPDTGGGGGISAYGSAVNINGSTVNSNVGIAMEARAMSSGPTHVTIMDSTLAYNTSGTFYNSGGRSTIIRSIIRNNTSGIGTNDTTQSSPILTIHACVIADNGDRGPAVEIDGGTAYITNTTIRNNSWLNHLAAGGGGIRNFGTTYVLNSAIIGNSAFESGGGIFNAIGHLYLTNSTITANTAARISGARGGGIYNTTGINGTGSMVVTNCTVANNHSGDGGGIRRDVGGSLVIRNTVVSGNTASSSAVDFSGPAQSDGFNLIGNITGSSGWLPTDLLNINPLLAPLGNNGGSTWTYALLPNSPAINAGNNDLARDPFDNSPLLNDQRGSGFLRLIGNVDIGAYEANYSMVPVTVGGRVTTLSGRGIAGARVTFTSGGTTLYAQTNPFGYYRFANLPPGTTYTVAATHKYYFFTSPVYVTIDQNRSDLNFTAQ